MSTDNTPQKTTSTGRGRNKDGTARKCANCGQVGHIKTNRKSVYLFICSACGTQVSVQPGGVVNPDDGSTHADASGSLAEKKKGKNGRAKKKAKEELTGFLADSYSKFVL